MPEQLIQGFVQGLAHLFTLSTFTLMVTGVIIGFIFGVVPGLSGYVALAVLLPFIYGMEPAHGLVFLLAAHSVNCTGGSISAILLGIPGTPVNAATLIDGFPMAQQGKAGQALGAALMSSMLGGIWGAVILALLIPVVIPFALAFRAPELFLLVMLSLSCVAGLSRGSLLKGLLSATLGFIISFIGFQGQAAMTRFTFGWMYLYDGVKLIPLTLGLFAMPIIFDLAAKGTTITETADSRPVSGAEVAEGVKDVFRHFWLFMRASAIGAVIGILPGIGADAATFLAYGHARQTSRHMERFGHGTVEGVIAPEAANNAKEGGALLPTLTLGIPGSGAMAILMGAFWLVGLSPGPMFLVENMDVGFSMIWALVIANIIAAGGALFFCGKMSKVALVKGHILAPFLLILVFLGTYCVNDSFIDVVVLLFFGALGYAMEKYDYNRPALMLGFILGHMTEKYFFIALPAYGPFFVFSSPLAVALLIMVVLMLSADQLRSLFKRAKGKV